MFRKKLYNSPLFGEEVWIVNLTPEQSLRDPLISSSGRAIFTEQEVGMMKGIDPELRTMAYSAIFHLKKVFPGSEIVYLGEEKELPPSIPFFKDDSADQPRPKVPERRRRRNRPITLKQGDAMGQKRLSIAEGL